MATPQETIEVLTEFVVDLTIERKHLKWDHAVDVKDFQERVAANATIAELRKELAKVQQCWEFAKRQYPNLDELWVLREKLQGS